MLVPPPSTTMHGLGRNTYIIPTLQSHFIPTISCINNKIEKAGTNRGLPTPSAAIIQQNYLAMNWDMCEKYNLSSKFSESKYLTAEEMFYFRMTVLKLSFMKINLPLFPFTKTRGKTMLSGSRHHHLCTAGSQILPHNSATCLWRLWCTFLATQHAKTQ